MSDSFDFIIAGNNMGALVAADSLSDKYSIALINSAPDWGAHFGSTVMNGKQFDMGMNFFEFTTFRNQSSDVISYNPSVRNDSARFFHIIESYIKSILELHEIDTPQMFLQGSFFKDIIISNNFEELILLPPDIKEKTIKELEIIVGGTNPLHASLKATNEKLFLNTNYKLVSLANHGNTLHDLFIEPLCRKICNIGPEQIPALFHRVPWAPLFHPETLLAFFKDNPPAFTATKFHYPKSGHFSCLTDNLVSKVQIKKNITILRTKIANVETDCTFKMTLDDGEKINSERLVWAMDLARYISVKDKAETEPFDKTSIVFVFLEIQTDRLNKNISTLYVLDEKYSIYRITNQTYCSGENDHLSKIVIEINYDYHKKATENSSEAELIGYSINALIDLSLIETKEAITYANAKILRNALNLPTLKNFSKFETMYNKVAGEEKENLFLIGPSSGFSSSSLNDQIIQGLKIATLFN